MSNCKNGGREALMPALRIEVDLSDGRTLHRDLALNGCEVAAVRIGGVEFVERRTGKLQCVKDGAMYTVWRYTCCGYEHAENVAEESVADCFCPKCGAEVTA